jgi:hypothetical protein
MYNVLEMRTFSTSIMAALIIAALFWGNCFSCPQLLLAAQRHGCCPHTKSAKVDCQTQGLKNFVKAEKSAPAIVTVVAVIEQPAPPSLPAPRLSAPRVSDDAPPDALPLRI